MLQSRMPSRLVRLVEPLGLYFRPGRNDHTTLLRILSTGAPQFTGVVMDASLVGRHKELRIHLAEAGVERVLDPMAMELATKGGWGRPALRQLPWAGDAQHGPTAVLSRGVDSVAEPISRFCIENGYNGVIAPSHYVAEGYTDDWWPVDRPLTASLRNHLDAMGGKDLPIYYRLAVPRTVLVDRAQRAEIAASLRDTEVDAVWLCLHPVNSRRSGPSVLKSYIDLCSDLRQIGLPLVAERTGFLGMALLGFNAVGGIESGITIGEGFDAGRLVNPRPLKPGKKYYSPGPRVYLPTLGVFLRPSDAQEFFAKRRTKSRFACQDRSCCRTPEEMFEDPRRHLVMTRASEVNDLMRVPARNRPMIHLETIRRASDDAVHAERLDQRFSKDRIRLDGWRRALSGVIERNEHIRSPAASPNGRVHHRKSA